MSTVPGESTWADAGLVPRTDAEVRSPEAPADEHVPDTARPDLQDDAAEPDVVEQAIEAGDEGEDDYRGA